MRVLITGGAGFVGSHLARWLLEQGHSIRILDNFSTGKQENLESIRSELEVVNGDIRDAQAVQRVAHGAECIFHLAALISVAESVKDPLATYATNVLGTLNVLEAARNGGCGRVVQASSSAVYGNAEELPLTEASPVQPGSPYAASKLAAEHEGQLWSRLYGVATVALRFFNIYGPGQDVCGAYAAVIPRFIRDLQLGKQPTIYGDGGQTRDFIYVGDVVRALCAAASTSGIGGAVFNVGSGEPLTVLGLAQLIGELMNREIQPLFLPQRAGDVRHSCSNSTLLALQTGFRPLMSLRSGLDLTIQAAVSGAEGLGVVLTT